MTNMYELLLDFLCSPTPQIFRPRMLRRVFGVKKCVLTSSLLAVAEVFPLTASVLLQSSDKELKDFLNNFK